MRTFKCKMCGADIEIPADKTFGTCEHCGSTMTFPRCEEDSVSAFQQAESLRRSGLFQEALEAYRKLLNCDAENAEAHWGAALCRFGIQYEEHPATYEYVPVCHNGNDHSFLEDPDYKAALQYSEGAARRLYQKEGVQIEECSRTMREEKSEKKAWDIFICCRKNSENGDRSVENALAQDLYYQLTQNKKRVFLSSVNLEGKTAEEQKAIRLAALHQAKVMLVLGTGRDSFLLEEVKQEWSHFLPGDGEKQNKILIPCYLNMDPRELPTEFSGLPSFNMREKEFSQKLGEVILKVRMDEFPENREEGSCKVPPSKPEKSNPQLQKAYCSLQKQEWIRAEVYFEEVLAQDAECSAAYLGKLLAEEQVSSFPELADKRIALTAAVDKIPVPIGNREERIMESIRQYGAPHYLPEEKLRALYPDEERYPSEIPGRKAQREKEKQHWKECELLSSAIRFAGPGEAHTIQDFLARIDYEMELRISRAAERENREQAEKESQYYALLLAADKKAEELSSQAQKIREEDYLDCLRIFETSVDPSVLESVLNRLKLMGDFEKGLILKEKCHQKLLELSWTSKKAETKENTEISRKKLRKKKRRIRWLVFLLILALLIAAGVLLYPMAEEKFDLPQRYAIAEKYLAREDYELALRIFLNPEAYNETSDRNTGTKIVLEEEPDAIYRKANILLSEGDFPRAILHFGTIPEYKDSWNQISRILEKNRGMHTIGAGDGHTLALDSDGTVHALGKNDFGQCNVADWSDVISVYACGNLSLGLCRNGQVLAVGDNREGQCNVSDWKNIKSLSAGKFHTAGVTKDGKVVAVGKNDAGQCNVSDWTSITAVACGDDFTVGLKEDGTVVAVGENRYGQCDVSEWKDITQIAAGGQHVLGLLQDGHVVAAGYNGNMQCNIDKWKDIVALNAGTYQSVGIQKDGTPVMIGFTDYELVDQVSDWKYISDICVGRFHVIGLHPNGKVTAVGDNKYGRCDVDAWEELAVISLGISSETPAS